MTKDEILKLIDAGFTKEEILHMEEVKSETPEQGEQAPAGDAPAEQPAQPADQPQPAAETPQQDAVLTALNRLTNIIVQHNLNDTVAESLTGRTPEDILAEIIAPPKRNLNK